MPFILDSRKTKEDAIPFRIFYEGQRRIVPKDGEEHPVDSNGEPAEFMTWYLLPMNGRVQREIADGMLELDQRGSTGKVRQGTSNMRKVIACTAFVEGLEFKGQNVSMMNEKIYSALPAWCVNAVLAKLDEINGEEEGVTEATEG